MRRNRSPVRWSLLCGCLVAAGCSSPAAEGSASSSPTTRAPQARSGGEAPPAPRSTPPRADPGAATSNAPPPGWPEQLVTSPGTGPALYLGAEPDAPAVGFVSSGVPFRLTGAPQGGRIPVVIEGPVEVRAWLTRSRLAGRIHRRGRVGRAPGYVGPNDVVAILGEAGEGLLEIELQPRLREGESLPAMRAVYPADRIGAREVDPAEAEGPSPGTPMRLPAGQEVTVYEQPGGTKAATLPALDPPLTVVQLVERGEWKGVRVGTGPYLVGFVNVALTEAEAAPSAAADPLAHPTSDTRIPIRLQSEPDAPLWQVEPDARVTFSGQTIAVIRETALAREMARHEDTNMVDVFVAADDEVAVRGMVPASALTPFE